MTITNERILQIVAEMRPAWLSDRTIFLARAGSQSYGTATPSSDLDVRGIAIPPKNIVLGMHETFEQSQKTGDPDIVIYDLRKFMALAANCNPNIIEILFTDEENVIKETPFSSSLRMNRNLFLTKKARHTFFGYALSQLKRIKTHRNWLLNPPKYKPSREDFGLSISHKGISDADRGAYEKLLEEGHTFDDNVMEVLRKEKEYANALTGWKQYQNWLATRNVARADLEAKYGFDVKHGMHLVRLMRMGIEILREGKVKVRRPDAEELIAIRNGAWTYDQLIDWASLQEKLFEEAARDSTLPDEPDLRAINSLCVELIENSIDWNR